MEKMSKKRGRPPVSMGPAFFLPILNKLSVDASTSHHVPGAMGGLLKVEGSTAKELGVSGYFMQRVLDRGYVESVNRNRGLPGRGRPYRAYKITDKGVDYVRRNKLHPANTAMVTSEDPIG